MKWRAADSSLTRRDGLQDALTPGLPHEASDGLAQSLPHLMPTPLLDQSGGAPVPDLPPAGIAQVDGAAAEVQVPLVAAGASASSGECTGRNSARRHNMTVVCLCVCQRLLQGKLLAAGNSNLSSLNISLTAVAEGVELG